MRQYDFCEQKVFTCVDCGESFESLAPPAETREDDPQPQCGACIEKDLDKFDNGPLDDDTIDRIMSKVILRRNISKAINAKMAALFSRRAEFDPDWIIIQEEWFSGL